VIKDVPADPYECTSVPGLEYRPHFAQGPSGWDFLLWGQFEISQCPSPLIPQGPLGDVSSFALSVGAQGAPPRNDRSEIGASDFDALQQFRRS